MSARFTELGTAQTPACHFTTEVFLREQGKWAVVDATPLKEYEVYYTVDGVPQSCAGHAPPRGQRHDGRRRKDRRMARPEKVSKAAAFEKLPPLCRELSPHGFRDVVDLGLANLVKDARKVGTILDFQETATVRYLVEFQRTKAQRYPHASNRLTSTSLPCCLTLPRSICVLVTGIPSKTRP